MTNRHAVSLSALAILLSPVAMAATVTDLRLLSVTKSDATLSVDLDEAAPVSVAWGEAPGEWTGHADASSATDHHQLSLTGLSPSTQYFYQVSVDGQPTDEMLTFRSGRSWVTRKATLLVSADVPQGGDAAGGEKELAERLFAIESDALVVLGGDGGKPDDFARLHRRSFGDRVVLAASSGDAHLDVADVRVVSGGALPGVDDGTCWRVGLGAGAPAGVDVAVTSGPKSSVSAEGGVIKLVLTDADVSGGARSFARLDFVEGHATVTLLGVDGREIGKAELTHACAVPKSKETAHASADGDFEAETSDADADASDCTTK